ncbi:unnamed protein product [Dibothriocephalus latus]|uniref:E3 ubiquitin-protein ligase n=1 Tax=Dibothriocephalus latus TaxID=60516 RepID=A0A3P6TS70_DIBLA|nr:unnamed protein product [Dibothriocephalus latus]
MNAYDEYTAIFGFREPACQALTHPKLARQLLLQNNAPLRLISHFCRTIAANAKPLSGFEPLFDSTRPANFFNPDYKFDYYDSVMQNHLRTLRIANQEAWRQAHEYTRVDASTDGKSLAGQSRYPPKELDWEFEMELLPERAPFRRALKFNAHLSSILLGLLYVKPLAGESESCPEGWWDEVSRECFLAYFRCLLEILSYVQDMHRPLEMEGQAWQFLTTFDDLFSDLSPLISLSALLASTDRTLLLSAIKETREAFEQRVGIIDLCFRVEPFTGTGQRDEDITSISFQTLGATSEVYESYVPTSTMSMFQPLPRLLAALYGYGIEMGLHPALLGLADEGYANLVIERPLQMVAFFAESDFWELEDDFALHFVSDFSQPFDMLNLVLSPSSSFIVLTLSQLQKQVPEMYKRMSAEAVGRDYQLLQQAAAVLPPDELIVRMVHKLNLKEYLSEPSSNPSYGNVPSAESLLQVLHFIVTSRSRHDVGYFDPSIVAAIPSLPHLFPPDFNDLDESLEIEHGLLVDDVIHQLCLHPMTSSEVLSAIPPQPLRSCLYEVPPYCGLRTTTGTNSSTSIDTEKVVASRYLISDSDLKGLISRVLQRVAIQTFVRGEQKYSLRPEVLVCRFDLFYSSYRLQFANQAKEAVIQALTQAREANAHLFPADFPIPPPPPRPRRRFVNQLNAPILRLLRCPTFVRLLRQLLDTGINYGSQQSNWSETLLELVLHLIIIAFYEDFVAFAETGERPFLKAVSLVPEASESAEELKHLAELRHCERQDPSSSTNNNCLVRRLEVLLEKPYCKNQADLIRQVQVSKLEEERRVKAERGSSLLAKMARMQRKLFAASAQLGDVVGASEKMSVQSEEVSVSSQHGMVVPALAAPSTVLSRLLPCTQAVWSDSEGTVGPPYCGSADWTWIDRTLRAIATSVVAASVGNGWALPSTLSRLLANLPSYEMSEKERTSGEKKKKRKKKKKSQPAIALSTRPVAKHAGYVEKPSDIPFPLTTCSMYFAHVLFKG